MVDDIGPSRWEKAKSVGRGIKESPYNILEKLKSSGGGIGGTFKWIFTWIFIILIILIILAAVIFIFRAWNTGTLGVISASLGTGVEPFTEAMQKGGFTLYDIWNDPTKVVEFLTTSGFEEKDVVKEEYGVKVTEMDFEKQYFEGDVVQVIIGMNVKAPQEKGILIDFADACELEDYSGSIVSDIKSYDVFSGLEEDIDYSCEFSEGVFAKRAYSSQEIFVKKFTFKPSYSFTQEVSLRTFTKEIKEKDDISLGKRESTSKGPLNLKLYTFKSQPFYSGDTNTIFVKFDNNDLTWGGNLKHLEKLTLHVPASVNLKPGLYCDFEEEGYEESHVTYTLKETEMNKVNRDCSEIKLTTIEQCISKYKDDFSFSCKFEVINAEEEGDSGTEILPFKAEAEYIYEIRKTKSLLFKRIEESKAVGSLSPINLGPYLNYIIEASSTYGIDLVIIKSVIAQESQGIQDAVSSAGAVGLMQLMPCTARGLGLKVPDQTYEIYIDPKDGKEKCRNLFSTKSQVLANKENDERFDPKKNIMAGTKHLASLYSTHSNWEMALAAYNWGGGNVKDNCGFTFDTCKNLPTETINYVPGVLAYKESYENEAIV